MPGAALPPTMAFPQAPGSGWARLPRAPVGPPRSLGPSMGGSFWQSWGVGLFWGKWGITLWASLGEGLLGCHCVFEVGGIYNSAYMRAWHGVGPQEMFVE